MACEMCDYDPLAVVLKSVSFQVQAQSMSLNRHVQNDRHGWAYRKARNGWTSVFKLVIPRIGKADSFRRVVITRVFSGRKRRWDRDNFIGGCKPVIDAMADAGLLVKDDEKHAQIHYRQVEGETTYTAFLVEVMACKPAKRTGVACP